MTGNDWIGLAVILSAAAALLALVLGFYS